MVLQCQLGSGCQHNGPFQIQSKHAFSIGILLPDLLHETLRTVYWSHFHYTHLTTVIISKVRH